MQPAAHKLLPIRTVALLIALCHAAAADAASRDGGGANLFAHGTDDRIWAARVAPKVDAKPPRDETTLITRGAGEEARWSTIADLPARAIAITRRGSELVVLLDGGDWKLVTSSDTGAVVRSGDRLPGGAPLLALAGNGDTLWAVGEAARAPSTTRSATQPATSPALERSAATTTSPTTTTAPAGVLTLFRLERGQWIAVAPIPQTLREAKATELAMFVIAQQPVLAGFAGDGRIVVFEFTTTKGWVDRAAVAAGETSRFELLALDGRAALWLAGPQGAGAIRRLDGDSIELKAADRIERDRVLASALGRLRMLYLDRDDKLHEQAYAADGAPVGGAMTATIERPVSSRRVGEYVQFAVMVLLLFVMSGTIRRRAAMQDAIRKADRLPLAPHGRRLLAGLVDAVPLLAVAIGFAVRGATMKTVDQATVNLLELWVWGAVVVYLIHTTTVEIFFGRSLGKMLLGLRPATLDGGRPGPRALLTRNLLRIIDIVLLFPLVMILFSPLRQRVGDLAAGTLVVIDGAKPLPLRDEDEVDDEAGDDDATNEPPRREN